MQNRKSMFEKSLPHGDPVVLRKRHNVERQWWIKRMESKVSGKGDRGKVLQLGGETGMKNRRIRSCGDMLISGRFPFCSKNTPQLCLGKPKIKMARWPKADFWDTWRRFDSTPTKFGHEGFPKYFKLLRPIPYVWFICEKWITLYLMWAETWCEFG